MDTFAAIGDSFTEGTRRPGSGRRIPRLGRHGGGRPGRAAAPVSAMPTWPSAGSCSPRSSPSSSPGPSSWLPTWSAWPRAATTSCAGPPRTTWPRAGPGPLRPGCRAAHRRRRRACPVDRRPRPDRHATCAARHRRRASAATRGMRAEDTPGPCAAPHRASGPATGEVRPPQPLPPPACCAAASPASSGDGVAHGPPPLSLPGPARPRPGALRRARNGAMRGARRYGAWPPYLPSAPLPDRIASGPRGRRGVRRRRQPLRPRRSRLPRP